LKYHEHCVIIPGWGYLPGRTDSQEAMVTKVSLQWASPRNEG
jgi:hypothetical protein